MATAMTSWKFLPREMTEPRALLPLIKSHLWKACIFTAGVTMIALSPICVHGNRKGNARALGKTQGLAQITLVFIFHPLEPMSMYVIWKHLATRNFHICIKPHRTNPSKKISFSGFFIPVLGDKSLCFSF